MDRQPSRKPEDEFELIAREAFKRVGNRMNLFVPLGIAIALVIWLASGIYSIQPSENGVIRTFGRHSATTGPGVGYRLPWPIQQLDVVDVQRVRRTEIGFRSVGATGEPEASRRILEEALMLTKDENIVEVSLIVQYQVKDPAAYTFNVQDPDNVLATTAEVALRSAVGQMPIDDVITERRAIVQENTRGFMTTLLNSYNTGILITDLRLQVADAPDQVRDSFQEVVRAREDRERAINEAQAYREDILPRARGGARQIIEQANAFQSERILLARGDSERFLSILREYRNAPEVTRERLHLEALELVLPKVDKVVIDKSMTNGLLPFLPLRDVQSGTARTTTGTSSVPPAPTQQPAPQPTATAVRPTATPSGGR